MSPFATNNLSKSSFKVNLLFTLAILLTPIAIYFSALNGPFIFDDLPNIVYNTNIKMEKLSITALSDAAHSLHSGPLGRPLAGISFAINYYLSDGVTNTFTYKVFNLTIHVINGILIFWFLCLVLTKRRWPEFSSVLQVKKKTPLSVFAGLVALLWVAHPIQLTSILYVVQRMTSMAAMFMLLAMIIYIYARAALDRKESKKSILGFIIVVSSGIAGVLCKETGLLLPIYILLIEYTLFKDTSAWAYCRQMGRNKKLLLLAISIGACLALLIYTIHYALPGYQHRDFSMFERVLTEARILIFYIAQIVIPRLSTFGLYHDDIPISKSLITPWTTLPSIIVVFALLFLALRYRHKYPLLTFSILWFFISHTLESTVFALEIIHEHRNYLASIGPILIFTYAVFILASKIKKIKLSILLAIIVFVFSATTTARSMQWESLKSLLEAETFYHPQSPRAWADLFYVQTKNNKPDAAVTSMLKAIHLKPNEPGYYLSLYLYTKTFNPDVASFANSKLLEHIRDKPRSTIMISTFHRIHLCLETSCQDMQDDFGKWITEARQYSDSPRLDYYYGAYLYAKGDYKKSLRILNRSIKKGGEKHASPFIKRIQVLLALGKYDEANTAYTHLKILNNGYRYVTHAQLQKLEQKIADAQNSQ
jgi:hypothetical protein